MSPSRTFILRPVATSLMMLGVVLVGFVAFRQLWNARAVSRADHPAVDRQGNPILIDEQTGLPLTEDQIGQEMAEQTHGQIRSRELDYSKVHSTHELAFWIVVASIECADILFAVDSILAAVALVGPAPRGTPADQLHPKLWVVIAGGMGGVVLMRFAAVVFIKLLDRFPRLETSAYLLVMLVGGKMVADYFLKTPAYLPRFDFSSPGNVIGWIFWCLVLAALAFGCLPKKARLDHCAN